MGYVLDTLIVKELVNSTETVNTDWVSDSIDITFREAEFGIQLTYDNGSSVEMDIWVAVSLDNVNFVRIDDSNQTVTDDSGTHIVDLAGTGTSYLRIEIDVVSGSIDINKLQVHMKRRH